MSTESDDIFTADSKVKALSRTAAATFLFRCKESILQAWESQCREKVLAAKLQSHPGLLNEIPKFIDQLILAISPDFKIDNEANSKVARDHGEERSDLSAYTLDQLIHEYQILRTILIQFLEAEVSLHTEVSKLIHEFIDQGIRKVASLHTEVQLKGEINQRSDSAYNIQELNAFFMQAPIAICVLDGPEHIFTLSNPLYDKLADRKVIGKKVRDAFTEVEVGPFFEILDRVFVTGEPYVGKETSVPLLDLAGELRERFIDFGYHPIRNSENKITSILAFHIDVTDQVLARKNLENSEARLLESQSMLQSLKQAAENERAKLASIFAQSPGAIAVFEGPDHVFTMVNPAYVTQFFGGRQDLIGQSVRTAIPEAVEQGFEKLLNTVYQTGVPYIGLEVPIDLRQTDGKMKKFHLNLVYQPLRDTSGKITGIVAVITDVTDQVSARMQLLTAKSDAEKANQTKSSFLANMSHEIRTPLGAILGFTDLLKDSELTFKERNQFLETILRNGKALTTIIDDILDLAKVESGKLDIENVDFSLFDLIDDVMDVFRERTRSKNIFLRAHLNKDTPARVFSDPTRIRQILINVVGNAVKFTAFGGVTIEVSAREISGEKTQFKILVKDSGVGLTSEQKERLFQPFVQADNSTTRKYGGTGLGLALSKRLATALGGDIFIEASEPAQHGCTFGFTFAASVPKQGANEVKIKDVTQKNGEKNIQLLSGIRVLLAEDSTDNQALVRLVLTKQGATVDTANNGVEAFKMGMSGNFDIALMDIQMPEMDGYEATRALREAGFKKPIVALTAHAMPEERARTLAAGCNAHLTKPLNQTELIETIERLTRYNKNKNEPRKKKSRRTL